ncbi:MAG TPA: TolC family protein, partial [Pyrinomonadaceae bacterium]|nr:TolC family protein [Pyrinomonadaceae bacterium]
MPVKLRKIFARCKVVGLLLLLLFRGSLQAQQSAPADAESLTLDQAIALALRDNHAMKIAQLEVDKADESISAAKTFRLPSLHAYTLVSGNLADNKLEVPNPSANLFPGLGPFFTLNDRRKPTAVFAASVIEPLTQQYRIGLNIKLEKVSRELAQAKLRQQQNETIDKVKKSYYAILQTTSALSSVAEALKSYHELDKVTGDYVMQQAALKADHLAVQTRLAKVEYEQLELSNRLAT